MHNPDDQADGFKDHGNTAPVPANNNPPNIPSNIPPGTPPKVGLSDEFKKAARELQESLGQYTAKNEWNFWFLLKQAAAQRDWKKFNQTLDDNRKFNISYQSFTSEAFNTACNTGELDVVKSMLMRGFRIPVDDAPELLVRLVKYFPEKGLKVAGYLAAHGHANPEDALYHIAARGTPQQMDAFKEAGVDVLTGGSSFFLAFAESNLPMMEYLHKNGASLYRASVIGLLYRDDGKDRTAAKAFLKNLLDFDAQEMQTYYAYVAPNHPTLDEFRSIPHGLQAERTTLMGLAARTGNFAEVIDAALKEDKNHLTAADLTREDASGTSPLAILLARGEAKQVLDPRLWQNRPQEIEKLTDALKALRGEKIVDPKSFAANVKQQRLRDQARSGRWSLSPNAPNKKAGGKP
ncbi:MAG: hypothetical protein PW788_02760 [Micavibrio sp.]|nr:hypothetical protein [Micavibrio sp.]